MYKPPQNTIPNQNMKVILYTTVIEGKNIEWI